MYAGYNPAYAYEKDPKPAKRPDDWQRGTEYTPVHLTLISRRVKKARFDWIKDNCRGILATYGMFAKGVDVPRLSGGVDATPRSQAEQMQGRILRKLDGKKKPIWITVADTKSYRSLFSLAGRIGDYIKNNAVVSRWSLDKGKEPCNARQLRSEVTEEVKVLRSMLIEPNNVGLNTLVTKQQQLMLAVNNVRSTNQSRPSGGRRSSATGSSRVASGGR